MFENKYGEGKSIVLMMVGSFYEMYGTNEIGPDLFEISEILNVVCTRRNSSIDRIDRNNPYLLGFPIFSSVNRIQALVNYGFVVIVIDQIGNTKERKITHVYSAGTYIENLQPDSNYVISIYAIEEKQHDGSLLFCFGLSASDLSTGKCYIFDSYPKNNLNNFDEVLQFYNFINPKEILFYSNSSEKCLEALDIDNKKIHLIKDLPKNIQKISFQNEFLKSIYKNIGNLNAIEYLNLTKNIYGLISFILMLNYVKEHNGDILNKLNVPEVYSTNEKLILGNNASKQLNILNNENDVKKFGSLFCVINNTSTALGRRFLEQRLLSPLTSSKKLNKHYDYVSALIEDKLYESVEKHLNEIVDIERLSRRIHLKILHPYELFNFITSYERTLDINNLLNDKFNSIKISEEETILKFITEIKEMFIFDGLKNVNINDITKSFFSIGKNKKIDELQEKVNIGINFMEKIKDTLKEKIKEKIYLKKNDRDGYYLSLTKTRLKKVIKILEDEQIIINDKIIKKDDFIINENNKTNAKMILKIKINEDVEKINDVLSKLIYDEYIKILLDISKKYDKLFDNVNNFISFIDFLKSNAKTAIMYNYVRPIIKKKKFGFINCNNLRHPIIERIIDYNYVPHSLKFGYDDLKGILLYGLNSCGKSSLMKSLGISIIMAQSGMFIPAESFIFSPYKKLYTRITGNDNIFKGLSSFAIEMLELRTILENADETTLVIGDEICRGTEHISGNAIVATTILQLFKLKSTFIFATHLHELINLDEIKKIVNIKAMHLNVEYNEKEDKLIYDRQLKEGSGDAIYGIKVARHLLNDKNFIDTAVRIKNKLIEKDFFGKPSKYNKNVYLTNCQICGTDKNLETHHIIPQKDFKSKCNEIKNMKSNLVALCTKCHDDLHDGKVNITGYILTSSGKELKN